ncbi:two-partner secretion domain-containing protein [Fischerella sp. PCC 9605]|uniref:two-partner secretion domain-containing protein n=1 Tax=Fischerella sp. PCC 9605 TaxID=1173024 RepID=UPI00047E8EAA|nr:S-layer family protein [Fischerella sp. PCC 9605]
MFAIARNWGYWLLVGGAIITSGNCALAQITPDRTLPNNSRVTPDGNTNIIEGGTQAGSNLFHSFEEFSVPNGTTAYFNNAGDLQNIISRVTGKSISNIDGLIRANGTANLFLINPNGIVFGRNASLNIGGSFIATTANSIKFADGAEFSATAPQTNSLLTISVPLGLQFGSAPENIVNQSQASDRTGEPVGLQVNSGKTLALVGGEIAQEGGKLTAPGGRIELGSVADTSLVTLNSTDKGWILGYEGIQNFQNIQLSQGAVVDASGEGGGDIHVQGRRVTVTDGSQIAAKTLGSGSGGIFTIDASESVEVSGALANFQDYSRLTTRTEGDGNAGALTITTPKLIVEAGGQISAGTYQGSTGQGGTLTINASDSVQVRGESVNLLNYSRLTTRTEGAGNAGALTINTGKFIVAAGGQVSSGTFLESQGNAGNLTVNASDSVEVKGASLDQKVLSRLTSRTEGAGSAGDMTINTPKLVISDGGQVSANTLSESKSNGGNLTVNASNSVEVIGFTINKDEEIEPSRLTTRTRSDGVAGDITINTPKLVIGNGGQVSAGTVSGSQGKGGNLTVNASDSVEVVGTVTNRPGNSVSSRLTNRTENDNSTGNLKISTGELIVRDGAEVGVNTLRSVSGLPGNLEVTARSILLDNGATLNARAASVDGGNIILQIKDLLLLRRNSQISASAAVFLQGNGNGGNITINAPDGFIVTVPDENSDIAANAYTGSGGRVQIKAQGIFGLTPRSREELQTLLGTKDPQELNPANLPSSDITAISRTNPSLSGQVIINTPDVDPNRGLINLPDAPVEPQVAQGCQVGTADRQSRFEVTGRGGLPLNPRETFYSDTPQIDWVTRNSGSNNRNRQTVVKNPVRLKPVPIVEATGWMRNPKGEVILTANASTTTPHGSWQTPANCRG